MTILGFGLAHIFFQLVIMVVAGALITAVWDEKDFITLKFKYVLTMAVLVGWFGVAVFINGFANVIHEDSACKRIDHKVNVDGNQVVIPAKLCQGSDGRMFIKGPKGEIR